VLAAFDMYVRQRVPWHRPADHAHMLEGLRKAGMLQEWPAVTALRDRVRRRGSR